MLRVCMGCKESMRCCTEDYHAEENRGCLCDSHDTRRQIYNLPLHDLQRSTSYVGLFCPSSSQLYMS